MAVVIVKNFVSRIAEVEFPDGKDVVGEAIEYDASCGCVIIFGVRYKGGLNETCAFAQPCPLHPKLQDNVLAMGQPGHQMYDEDTDKAVSWAIIFGGE